jgi:transposase
MARTGRPKAELTLSDTERATLERWARRAKSSQVLALRAKIILSCAEGRGNKETAALLRCHEDTVGKWRRRFIGRRLDGLADEARPGRKPTIADEQVEKVVVDTLEETPDNATHWSRASMAKRSGLSKSTVGRIWKAFHLKPHAADTFKLSSDPFFIDKVHDVVGLYLNPPEHAVVLCADEKSQVQALDRSQPVLPMMPGMPEKRTHDYVRHGTVDLFAAFDTANGVVIAKTYKWLAKRPRFHIHFTPTSSSWLNQVERWFGLLTEKLLRRGVHKSVRQLERDILAWVDKWNEDPKPFIWTKSAEEILESLGRLLGRIKDPGH